jgi:ATP adenylyltransferase
VDILWAGWRSEYITSPELQDDSAACLFCRLPDHTDADGLIIERGERAFTLLNRYPYTTGHFMVAQYRHVASPGDLDAGEQAEIWGLMTRAMGALDAAMKPHGYNLGANLGRVAGAGVPGHLHLHVVPRWRGDTNFMTAVGGTRVLPEDLEVTRQRIRDALGRTDGG